MSEKPITIRIPGEDAALIEQLLVGTKNIAAGISSHGPLNMEKLAAMLLEDVALAVRRPGSWEGSNMLTVLHSHGYQDI